MNYYEHHLGDYLRDTVHLSMLEDGAYRRLLDAYYVREAPLPADVKEVCRLVRAQTKPEKLAVETVLREFFTLGAEGWHQNRCDGEIARFKNKQTKAKRSAEARWSASKTDCKSNAKDMRTHTEGNALQTPVTSHQTPDKITADARAGVAITRAMEDELLAAAGNSLNLPGSPELLVMSRPLYWLQCGYDWELDVIPTIKIHAAKGRPYTIRSWNYFDGPIADAHARRTKPMPKGNTDERASGRRTAGDTRYDAALAGLRASGDC